METKLYQKHSSVINSKEFKRYCILYKRNKDSIVNLDNMDFASETRGGVAISIIVMLISVALFVLPNIDEVGFFEIIGSVFVFFIVGGFLVIPLSFVFSAILFSALIKPVAQLIHKKSKSFREFNILKASLSSQIEELCSDINYYVENRSKVLIQELRTSASFEDCKNLKKEFTHSFEFINQLHQFLEISVYSFIWDAERLINSNFNFEEFDEETKRRKERYLSKSKKTERARPSHTTTIKTNTNRRKISIQKNENATQTITPNTPKYSSHNKKQQNSSGGSDLSKTRNNSNTSLKPKLDQTERKKILGEIDALTRKLGNTVKGNNDLISEVTKQPTSKNSESKNENELGGRLNRQKQKKSERTEQKETAHKIDIHSEEPKNTIKGSDSVNPEKTNSLTRKPHKINHEKLNEKKIEIGRIGEEFVFFVEQEKLIDCDSPYKNQIQHVSTTNDGLGYDIISYDENGRKIFIEVKSTTQEKFDDLFFSINELNVMKDLKDRYYLYRVYNLDLQKKQGKYIVYEGYQKIIEEFEFISEELSGKFDRSIIN